MLVSYLHFAPDSAYHRPHCLVSIGIMQFGRYFSPKQLTRYSHNEILGFGCLSQRQRNMLPYPRNQTTDHLVHGRTVSQEPCYVNGNKSISHHLIVVSTKILFIYLMLLCFTNVYYPLVQYKKHHIIIIQVANLYICISFLYY